MFTVAGGSKAPIVAALARGEDLPAARVRTAALWLIDRAAFGPAPEARPDGCQDGCEIVYLGHNHWSKGRAAECLFEQDSGHVGKARHDQRDLRQLR